MDTEKKKEERKQDNIGQENETNESVQTFDAYNNLNKKQARNDGR